MTERLLDSWRSHLTRLRRGRLLTCALGGILALAAAGTGILLALFALDWLFRFQRIERALLLVGAITGLAWLAMRWLIRPLGAIESELELAVELERRHNAEGDWVAALQFDAAGPGRSGSAVLEQVVVRRVAAVRPIPPLPDHHGFVRLRQAAAMLVLTGAVMLIAFALWPRELGAYFKRMLLARVNYPAQTIVRSVLVNGLSVDHREASPAQLNVPLGASVRFEVECSGVLPPEGAVAFHDENGVERGRVVLAARSVRQSPTIAVPSAAKAADSSAAIQGAGTFTGEIERLLEPVSCRFLLGDAEIEPVVLEVVPFPIVAIELLAIPPAYAGRERSQPNSAVDGRISVLEGSQVRIGLRSENKALQSAILRIGEIGQPLEPVSADRRRWRLPKSAPAMIAGEPLTFEIEVIDNDGLSPQEPVRGQITIETDHPPTVAAGVVTRTVLASAEPSVTWGVSDDFGLARVQLRWQVIRSGVEVRSGLIPLVPQTEKSPATTKLRGTYRLRLAELEPEIGDEVRLTLEAIDDRGAAQGALAATEASVLHVSDENGVLAALAEDDERSAVEIEAMIQQELNLGAFP